MLKETSLDIGFEVYVRETQIDCQYAATSPDGKTACAETLELCPFARPKAKTTCPYGKPQPIEDAKGTRSAREENGA